MTVGWSVIQRGLRPMIEWFRRFGDIAGVSFTKDPSLDPSKLVGYAAVPEQNSYDLGGEHHEYLMWSYGDSMGSGSPAHGRAFSDRANDTSAAVLQNCMEGLELPGEASDYHFLISGAASELWSRRRAEPEVIAEVERLCWLDLQLVEARPDCVTIDQGEGSRFLGIPAFDMLINLFEREGALYEALDVAERADRFGQGSQQRDELRQRIAAMENEARE